MKMGIRSRDERRETTLLILTTHAVFQLDLRTQKRKKRKTSIWERLLDPHFPLSFRLPWRFHLSLSLKFFSSARHYMLRFSKILIILFHIRLFSTHTFLSANTQSFRVACCAHLWKHGIFTPLAFLAAPTSSSTRVERSLLALLSLLYPLKALSIYKCELKFFGRECQAGRAGWARI